MKNKLEIKRYQDWCANDGALAYFRRALRDAAVSCLSIPRRVNREKAEIRFVYYHHIFNDERKGFDRQLHYLRNFGEFISHDFAVDLITKNTPIDGRYIAISFDDGFKCCFENALPVLLDHNASAMFYVVTDLIGKSISLGEPIYAKTFGARGAGSTLSFLSWDNCKKMVTAGMEIGSHTRTHPRLISLSEFNAKEEMRASKLEIEKRLSIPCQHFCAPFGRPGVDFNSERDPKLAASIGYKSFASGFRGNITSLTNSNFLNRDQLIANWGNQQIRYFLGSTELWI